jgi:hypothetical protein
LFQDFCNSLFHFQFSTMAISKYLYCFECSLPFPFLKLITIIAYSHHHCHLFHCFACVAIIVPMPKLILLILLVFLDHSSRHLNACMLFCLDHLSCLLDVWLSLPQHYQGHTLPCSSSMPTIPKCSSKGLQAMKSCPPPCEK